MWCAGLIGGMRLILTLSLCGASSYERCGCLGVLGAGKTILMKQPTADIDLTGSDEALIAQVAHHEAAALEALYARHRPLLRGIVLRVLHDEADAEDVLQDTFVQVWQRADSYSVAKGKPFGWLVTLARRRAIDCLRRRQNYRKATTRFEVAVKGQHAETIRHRPVERQASGDDLRQFLCDQLGRLPPAQKRALELTFFEGLSQRQIEAKTHIPLGTIKTRIELGLRKLAVALWSVRGKVA
jgi:RNA polymerase sigma-70 factor (ECF subfamily)